jgi:hypothetical protein
VGSRPAIEEHVVNVELCLYVIKFRLFVLIQSSLPIDSVRRRNALHEVGGRVPEEPRVRNARAGRETHTHFILTHSLPYAHKIKS